MITSPRRPSFSITALCVTTIALFSVTGCSYNNEAHVDTTAKSIAAVQNPAVQKVVGDYASEGYGKRAQGNDWVGVMVSPHGASDIEIKVRARRDVKKPTCHFDGRATLMGQDDAHGVIFQSKINDSTAFFQFKDDKLIVDSQDKFALHRFCSGGGTLVGDYQKLSGKLELS